MLTFQQNVQSTVREGSLSPGSRRIGMQLESKLSEVFHAENALHLCVMQLLQYVSHPLAAYIESEDDVILERLNAAMTNIVYRCSSKKCKDSIIIRFYGKGTDTFFKRSDETKIFQALSDRNIGPQLIAKFGTGRLEGYLNGYKALDYKLMRKPEITKEIMKQLAEFHQVEIPGLEKNGLNKKLQKWCAGARIHSQENSIFNIDNCESEVQSIRDLVKNVNSPHVFLHADLQAGNIMLNKGKVKIIDFEYSCYGPRGFDFANFFLECCYDYNGYNNYHLNKDWFPNDEEQSIILSYYLESINKSSELDQLKKETEIFICYSLLVWILWGIVQSEISGVDFDYKQYTLDRIDLYYEYKKKVFGIESSKLTN